MGDVHEELQALALRVETLERQSRRWKLTSTVVALIAVSLLLVARGHSETVDKDVFRATTIESQNLLLKDETGRVRARLSMHSIGKVIEFGGKQYRTPSSKALFRQASLQFFDEDGEEIWLAPMAPTVEYPSFRQRRLPGVDQAILHPVSNTYEIGPVHRVAFFAAHWSRDAAEGPAT